jgi:hypothetical protein
MLSASGINKACEFGFAQAMVIDGPDTHAWATVWVKCLRTY